MMRHYPLQSKDANIATGGPLARQQEPPEIWKLEYTMFTSLSDRLGKEFVQANRKAK
jgi:hypothetical protein